MAERNFRSDEAPEEPAVHEVVHGAGRKPVDDLTRQRLERWQPLDRVTSWYWAGAVTLFALVLRMVNIQHPSQIIFDETYYANHAKSLLNYGYERNLADTAPEIAAHPPFGKWCIALGEWLFGYNTFGWRFSAALAGALSVLLITRVARRLFRSTLLGCLAGGLLSLEGLHFVSSRLALLDIFLLLLVFAAFGCLLLDRESRRARLLAALESGVARPTFGSGWRFWPWGKLAAGLLLGLGLSVKWSALWFAIVFVVLVAIWEIQARRAAGIQRPISDAIASEAGWLLAAAGVALVAYLATWTGWMMTDGGYDRNWAAEHNGSVWYLPDVLVNLWHYHSYIYEFHSNLAAKHEYQSTPLSWLIMDRPVLYYADTGDCGAAACKATISGMSTPLLWWSFVPAWLGCLWQWVAGRDWRAGAIVLCAAAGFVPWLLFGNRTMFFFYVLPMVPFLVLAVTMMLGLILGKPTASAERRLIGGATVVTYVIIIAMTFVYFYPVLTGTSLPLDQWEDRMWFESWQ